MSDIRRLSNGDTVVSTWRDDYVLNKRGRIDEQAKGAFSNGHCHSLALAVNELTGWPMYAAMAPFDDEGEDPTHVFNLSPKGFVDIKGLGVENRWYMGNTFPVSEEDINNFETYLQPRPKLAKKFAKTLLKQLGVKPLAKGV